MHIARMTLLAHTYNYEMYTYVLWKYFIVFYTIGLQLCFDRCSVAIECMSLKMLARGSIAGTFLKY